LAIERVTQKRQENVKNNVCYSIAAVAALAVVTWAPLRQTAYAQGYVAPVVFQAAGPTAASIQASVDAFRAALGGTNNGNAPGPLAEGRREINWDGGGATTSANAETPFTGFQTTRGALFTTPGNGFVQATLPGLATTFGNLTYETNFQFFSPIRVFSAIGSNVTEARFFVPGNSTAAATTTGFGAIFTDVDQPDGSGPGGSRGYLGASALIEYFGSYGELLFTSAVPSSPGSSLSFFGVVYSDARIARVRITSGDGAPGPDDQPHRDVVMMDDFIYGEPRVQP
jgi:hypothetical protein